MGLGRTATSACRCRARQGACAPVARGSPATFVSELPLVDQQLQALLCLATLQMTLSSERFPARASPMPKSTSCSDGTSQAFQRRLAPFLPEIALGDGFGRVARQYRLDRRPTDAFAKGLYTCSALRMQAAYPFCDALFREWVYREVPPDQLIDPKNQDEQGAGPQSYRHAIRQLPYVEAKGSFRFDLRGLAGKGSNRCMPMRSRRAMCCPAR